MRTYKFSEICVFVFHQLNEAFALVLGVSLQLKLGKLTGTLSAKKAVFDGERHKVEDKERR